MLILNQHKVMLMTKNSQFIVDLFKMTTELIISELVWAYH